MIWLGLAVACSLSIVVVFKMSERRGLDRTALLTVNYAVAGLVSAAVLEEGGLAGEAGMWALGIATGVLFIAGFYVFAYAIRAAGMGLAAGVMRLSVVLPFLASWLVWGEAPTAAQLGGLVLAGCAFFLLARPAAKPGRLDVRTATEIATETDGGGRTGVALALLFLAGGLVDIALKTFGEVYAATNSQAAFLLLVFGVAFLSGLVLVLRTGLQTGRWPRRGAYTWGLFLGLVNYGSAEFILRALAQLDGTFVFPANSVSIVMGAALIGVVVWRERLTRLNGLGLALAALALLLLAPRGGA